MRSGKRFDKKLCDKGSDRKKSFICGKKTRMYCGVNSRSQGRLGLLGRM